MFASNVYSKVFAMLVNIFLLWIKPLHLKMFGAIGKIERIRFFTE